MAQVKRPRRYYHGQRAAAAELEQWDLAGAWRWKQEKEPGTPLPDDFPYTVRLSSAGYTAHEDLDGADAAELGRAGFSPREAQSILAALAELPPL
jgi:hypothetical protein